MTNRNIMIFFAGAILFVIVLVSYGIYVNKASSAHMQKMIAAQFIEVKGDRVTYREVYPELYMQNMQLKSSWGIDIYSRFDAKLDEICVAEGDLVITGQLLAKISNDELNLQILQADANIKETQADLKRWEKDFERYSALAKQGAASLQQVDNTKANIDSHLAHIEAQRAYRNQLATRMESGNLVAPRSAKVIKIYQMPGTYVSANTPIMLIATVSNLYLEAELENESAMEVFSKDKSFKLKLGNDFVEGTSSKAFATGFIDKSHFDFQYYDLTLLSITPELDTPSKKRVLVWQVENNENKLHPGTYQYGKISMTTPQKLLTIPKEAIFEDTNVFVVTNSNYLELRKIKTNVRNDNYVQVLEGLIEGETVVTSIKDGLYNEAAVKVSF